MEHYDFDLRKFQVWSATPSFARLLLRSPMNQDEGIDHNIDVCFQGVTYVDIPWYFTSLKLKEVTDISTLNSRVKNSISLNSSRPFLLVVDTEQYFVVANRVTIDRNQLDIFEVPFSTPHNEGRY